MSVRIGSAKTIIVPATATTIISSVKENPRSDLAAENMSER
jgi:hypothetical protein